MFDNRPIKVMYIQQPKPVKKTSHRSPFRLNRRSNKIFPHPAFTCIDEVYSSDPLPYRPLEQTQQSSFTSSQKSKDETTLKPTNWRKWLLTIIIIVIILCIIAVVILLAVFLTRSS